MFDFDLETMDKYEESLSRLLTVFKKTPKSTIAELRSRHGFQKTLDILLGEVQDNLRNTFPFPSSEGDFGISHFLLE